MSPQGESSGFALEDAVLFARILSHHDTKSLVEIFNKYQELRRKRMDAAYNEATFRWETVKDKGWVATKFVEIITASYLWWTKKIRDESFGFDVGTMDLGW